MIARGPHIDPLVAALGLPGYPPAQEERVMASVYRRKGSPFWWFSYKDREGKWRAQSSGIRFQHLDPAKDTKAKFHASNIARYVEYQESLARAGIIDATDLDTAKNGRADADSLLKGFIKRQPPSMQKDMESVIRRFIEEARIKTLTEFGAQSVV